MNRFVGFALVFVLAAGWAGQPAAADDGCSAAFDDVRNFTADVFERIPVSEDGVIAWDTTDWENIVRRMVGSSEFYLNNCTEADQPLSDQPDALWQLKDLSVLQSPVSTLDLGGDFGEVALSSEFVPQTELIDLNGDGADELVLHTQVPYFSHETAYQFRGGLSIAFFYGDDGWQGQVIAPVTRFVTDESGDHVSFAMVEDNTLSAETASEALRYFPAPGIELILADDGTLLTAITLVTTTGTGEARELNILTWDGRFPSVELRVAFDDWCYPGSTLDWEIRADGSVFVPSNGGEEGSPLHCGRTSEVLFAWEGSRYVSRPSAG